MVGVWKKRRNYVHGRGHRGGVVRMVGDKGSGQGEG